MIRTLFLITAVIAIPLGGAAGVNVALSSSVSASPPPPVIICQLSGVMTFPAPGLSEDGVWTTASTSAGSIAATLSGAACPGLNPHMPAQTFTIPNPHCGNPGNPSPVCTGSSGYVSDSASGYVTAGAAFWSEVPNLKFHIANLTYKSHSVSSIVIAPGGICGATESGFRVRGHVTLPGANAGDHTRLTLCFDADTGPGTTGNFLNDISSEIGGNASMTIASAELDPTSSQLKIWV